MKRFEATPSATSLYSAAKIKELRQEQEAAEALNETCHRLDLPLDETEQGLTPRASEQIDASVPVLAAIVLPTHKTDIRGYAGGFTHEVWSRTSADDNDADNEPMLKLWHALTSH